VVRGAQTAVVVGPSGDEIYTDEYGRIKVQFHWDREGTNDQNPSLWIRVSQPWAGADWGAFFLPRIGDEVIVDFLEGDPDRPLVIGSVYNQSNLPPYAVTSNRITRTGIKSRGTGASTSFNEIRFEDKAGEEQIVIHADKLSLEALTVEVGSTIRSTADASPICLSRSRVSTRSPWTRPPPPPISSSRLRLPRSPYNPWALRQCASCPYNKWARAN
jgi:type VI secretion system VgrG family protein